MGSLQTQKDLQDRIANLRAQLVEAEHQKELFLARALKAERRTAPLKTAQTPSSRPVPPPAKTGNAPRAGIAAAKTAPTPPVPKEAPPPPPPPAKAAKPKPVVSVAVEKFNAAYEDSEKALTTQFIIRNTGNTQAEGRAVVVLSASEGNAIPRLSLPPVPLQNDRPRGNRGRRFSISRFMRLKLQRKVAEPGLRFDTADVFVFDMQGKLLQEQSFEVAVNIPAAEPPPPAAAAPSAEALPAAATPPAEAPATNPILVIPSNSEQEPQGGQDD